MAVSNPTTNFLTTPYTRGMIRARGGATGILSMQGDVTGDATGGASTVTVTLPAAEARRYLWRVLGFHIEMTAQAVAADLFMDLEVLWEQKGVSTFTHTLSGMVSLPGFTLSARHPLSRDLSQWIGLLMEPGGIVSFTSIKLNENGLVHSFRVWLERIPIEAEAPFTGRHTER